MIRRRHILALSIAVSLCLHGTLLAVSPRIGLMAAPSRVSPAKSSFRVQLRDDIPIKLEAPGPAAKKGSGSPDLLTSRPESILDLLKRETERLKPSKSMVAQPGDASHVVERAVAEPVHREHELQPEPSVSQGVDAQIIAISEDAARKDIAAPRRLVSPVSTRILAENETPVMTGGAQPLRQEVLSIPPLWADSGGTDADEAMDVSEPPPLVEKPAPELEPIPPTVTAPLDEVAIAPSPAVEEVQKDRNYEFMDDLLSITLDTYKPAGEKEAFFRIRIQPKQDGKIEILPKDVIFVIDASSSIIQRKLDMTAGGVKDAIKTLRPEDRFNVVVFRDTATLFQPAPAFATPENKTAAESFVTGLKSYGETDVFKALSAVLQEPTRPGIPDIVLLITDGRPTAGMKDGRTIINTLTEQNAGGHAIFAFGGGPTVNRYLLDLLAYRNRGESEAAQKIESMNRDLVKLFSSTSDPILSECAASFAGIGVRSKEIYPREIPDFYSGRAVTLYGRFDPSKDKEFSVRLSGLAGPRKKEVIFRADLKKAGAADLELARNWAFNKIYYLIGEMCRVGEKPELLNELRELSRKYKIKTSYDG